MTGDLFLVYRDDFVGALAFGRTRGTDPLVTAPVLFLQRRTVQIVVYIRTGVGWKTQRERRERRRYGGDLTT